MVPFLGHPVCNPLLVHLGYH